jgi:hypothetical protein
MTKIFVHSTLTNSQAYTVYDAAGLTPVKSININGGNGLNNRHLITVNGAVTEVTEEDYELLQKNHLYQRHVANGFITVSSDDNAERVAGDLESRDGSAPMNQNDVDQLMEDTGLGVTLDFDVPQAARKTNKRD